MLVKVVLVDINRAVVAAWREAFERNPEVEVIHGSMLDQPTSAWCSPTNSFGRMDGGLDAVIKNQLGAKIERKVQAAIRDSYGGRLPIGHAVCTPTDKLQPRYLISTPTMAGSSEDVSGTMNVALAAAAAFQAVNIQNYHEPGSIRSVAIAGLGASTGQVPPHVCADLMWTGYNLFRDREFRSFEGIRAALEEQLGPLDTLGSASMLKGSGFNPGLPDVPGDDWKIADDQDEEDEMEEGK